MERRKGLTWLRRPPTAGPSIIPNPVAVSRRPKTVATLFGKQTAVTAKLAVLAAVQPTARATRRTKQSEMKTTFCSGSM